MEPTRQEESDRVMIRVKNATDEDFSRVEVNFPGGHRVDYGAVEKGGVSAFHETQRAYRYAAIKATVGDRELSLQPMDYVGEQELAAGRYTYVLGIAGGQLTVTLEEEN